MDLRDMIVSRTVKVLSLSHLLTCLPPASHNRWPPPHPQPSAQGPQTPLPQDCITAATTCAYILIPQRKNVRGKKEI